MCYRTSSDDASTLCGPQPNLVTTRPKSEEIFARPTSNWQPNQFPDSIIRSNGREQEIKLSTESRDGDEDLRTAESFNIGIYTWPNHKPWSLFGGHGHGHGHHHHGFWPPPPLPWGPAPWGAPWGAPWPPLPFHGGWCC